MRKPAGLKKGDTVALVSLSSGMAGEDAFAHRVALGRQRLEEIFDLKVVIMPHAMKGMDYLYKNPQARADDLMEAFSDSRIKAVISMIGGDDTVRLLPYIDYDILRSNPKIFMGYSDTTANHLMMYKAGISSFYGPCVLAQFAENAAMHPYTEYYIRKTLFEGKAPLPITPSPQWTSEFLDWGNPDNNTVPRTLLDDKKGYELIQGKGSAQGHLLGGCIDVFPMIMGTEIWPDKEQWEGSLLFIETSEEYIEPSVFRYLLRGLIAQGVIAGINGILCGKPKDEKYYDEYRQVLLDVIGFEAGRPDLPILYNMNFGHTDPICILPYGTQARIDVEDALFTLLEPAVV